jgi:cellulose synthase/poly-beta-1,6-N-acetylglucosamine synthase-like glycosyltransferase
MRYDEVTLKCLEKNKFESALVSFTKRQMFFYFFFSLSLFLLLLYRWDYFIFLVTAWFAVLYFSSAMFRVGAAMVSLLGLGERKITDPELKSLNDEELPVYTILVPLYKEANIAKKILRNIMDFDYPKDKLDIKILLEADDSKTLEAVKSCGYADILDVIVVPDSQPKTKPRACNWGLEKAKGEFCVIYDAEDRPEPDQLKKALVAFRSSPEKVICVQAKLNYYNQNQNILTRLFTIEYSTTFDLFLPGLETLKVPVPLGGTSNHFRTGILKEIGGWDPFNVTEDCELGMRIYKRGYSTIMINSTTWEEANSKPWNWIRQRSRWVKGYIQTHFVHARKPIKTYKALGAWGFAGFYLTVGASVQMMLMNVFYWIVGIFYLTMFFIGINHGYTVKEIIVGPHSSGTYSGVMCYGMELKAWPLVYYGPDEASGWVALSVIFFSISFLLLLANLLFVGIHCIACMKRRYYSLLPFALLMPFYWLFISFGAWKGFIQFFTKPFYWEKTVHFDDGEGS